MNDVQLENLVMDEVLAKTELRETFTAWDITNSLRASNTRSIYHGVVRHLVHRCIVNDNLVPDYNIVTGDFFEKGEVRVYHHNSVDPTIYIRETRISLGLDVPAIEDDDDDAVVEVDDDICVLAAKDDDIDDGPEVIIKTVDSKNRIRFTKHILESAGFSAGDICYVKIKRDDNVSYPNACVVVSDIQMFGSKMYKIDMYNNLRVSLNTAGYTEKDYILTVPRQGMVVARSTDILSVD